MWANLNCTGEIKGSQKIGILSSPREVETYAVQSTENWIEDFGSGELRAGVATVTIDPEFAQTVNTEISYHIYLTPNGDTKGLYVTEKQPGSFVVREAGGGQSNIAFDYRIVAKRKGHESERLVDVTEQNRRLREAMLKHMPQAASEQ
jgi:hypothetical protein